MIGVCHGSYINWEIDLHMPEITFMGKVIAFLGYYRFPEPQTFGEKIQLYFYDTSQSIRNLLSHILKMRLIKSISYSE